MTEEHETEYVTLEAQDEFIRLRREASQGSEVNAGLTANIDFVVEQLMARLAQFYRKVPIRVDTNRGELVIARRGKHFQFCTSDASGKNWVPIKGSPSIDAAALLAHGTGHVNKLKFALEKAIQAWVPTVADATIKYERSQGLLSLAICYVSFPAAVVEYADRSS